MTWRVSMTTSHEVNALSCASPTTCVAVWDGGAYRTVDGGTSWSAVAFTLSGEQAMTSVSCPTTRWCMAAGDRNHATPLVESTDDGGSSWSTVRVPASMASPRDVSCWALGACALVGSGSGPVGVALTTSNGGGRWTVDHVGTWLNVVGVSCAGAHCLAIGVSYAGEGILSLTVR
jgi:hypothetical protein